MTKQFAAVLDDPRNPEFIDHSFLDIVRMRLFGMLPGYEDPNDHDTLRCDSVFKLIADRTPHDAHLASQPTLSRFENPIQFPSLKRLRELLVDQFIVSFARVPLALTFDLDTVDDQTHSAQQLSLFHGYYEQHQYLSPVVTSAETDQIVLMSLHHGTAAASLRVDDDLEFIVTRVRAGFTRVTIRVRGDCGFGVPTIYETCERLDIIYTFGQSSNMILQAESEELLVDAAGLWDETREPHRLFAGFWYQAKTWLRPRWTIVKAEANSQRTNRRFVVTSRRGGPATWKQHRTNT